ncbi:MAG: hypothetical protein PUC12_07040 [Clostridiales bacterium]|nr:hypothetical protein [Clostridiales bacterium]
MKKRLLKLLSMLLISAIMINVLSPMMVVKAAEFEDIGEIPVLNYDQAILDIEARPSKKINIIKEDEGKVFKINIPEYSYFDASCFYRVFFGNGIYNDKDCKVSLYGDSNLNSLICNNLKEIHLFLPRGDYYLKLESYEKIYPSDFVSYISFYRTPIKEYTKGKIEKKKNRYYIHFIVGGGYSTRAFGTYKLGTYDIPYEYCQDLNKCFHGDYDNVKDVYKKLNFSVEVNKKKADPIVTFGKTENNILKIEANGGIYDVNNSENNTSSKKKDTKKPTVKGVKNNKTYKKSVKFKVSDKSGIKKVTLNKKKIKVSKAKKGYTVKKKGTYTLKVWDKAGNVRTVKFKIKK